MADDKPVEHGPRSFAVEGNDLTKYVGTNPEYMTYAEDTHKPLQGEGDDADDANVEAFVEQVADPSAAYREQLEKVGEDPSDAKGLGQATEQPEEEDESAATGPQPGSHGQPGDSSRSDAEKDKGKGKGSNTPPA